MSDLNKRIKREKEEEKRVNIRIFCRISFIVLFNLFFFLITSSITTSMWITYGFVTLSWIMALNGINVQKTIEVLRRLGHSDPQIESFIVRTIIYRLYYYLQGCVGIIFIVIRFQNYVVSATIQVVLLLVVIVSVSVVKHISKKKK